MDSRSPRSLARSLARRAAALAAAALVVLALLAGSGAVTGCGDGSVGAPSTTGPRAASRVLVVGMDGLEWSVLRPLLQEGRCPNLAVLMRRGSFGRLATLSLTLSPVVWTTIATGRMPKDHGIKAFLDEGKVYTSSDRRVRALWNIADRYGLSTNMFGWFITWPAEQVKGLVVSGSSSSALSDANWKPALVPSVPQQVWPPEREADVMALAEQAGAKDAVMTIARRIYGAVPDGALDAEHLQVQQQTLWSLAADATYFALARKALAESPADLNLVYFGGSDVVGHRYWREYRPEGFQWKKSEAADAALSQVIPNYYCWLDEMLGELVAAAGPDATVIVVSDHGMHAIAQDKENAEHMTGHHLDAPAGVLIAAGPGIAVPGEFERFLQSGALASMGSVTDVAPTVLALLGLPGARDMEGHAFRALLAEGPARECAALPSVESHDVGYRPAPAVAVPGEMDESFKEKFNALGYLQLSVDPNEDVHVVAPETTPAR